MGNSNEVYNSILEIMDRHSPCLFGIADISYSDYASQYKCALVIAVPHKKIMTKDVYSEEELDELICKACIDCDGIISQVADFCREQNIEYHIPPIAQESEKSLVAPFSYKFAAVNAGLGWIGKNDLLITKEYGPRVRLAAILLGFNLPVGKPIKNIKCDDKCNYCVEACPYNFLKGVKWDVNKYRDELIDYHSCNNKRSLYIKKHGRKNACGLCMVSCPFGVVKEWSNKVTSGL
ncbi:MAG TPA: epoxyqueuosine reductase [Clostridiaceae bacterium]|nr:epoxyqueuosine reductase [Clostridiaceae bacterium]